MSAAGTPEKQGAATDGKEEVPELSDGKEKPTVDASQKEQAVLRIPAEVDSRDQVELPLAVPSQKDSHDQVGLPLADAQEVTSGWLQRLPKLRRLNAFLID